MEFHRSMARDLGYGLFCSYVITGYPLYALAIIEWLKESENIEHASFIKSAYHSCSYIVFKVSLIKPVPRDYRVSV